MRVIVGDEPLALVGAPRAAADAIAASGLADPAAGASLLVTPDEVTLIVPWTRALAVRSAFADARVEGPFRLLTLDVVLEWHIVGFFARVAGALADAGVVIGALSGFSRDHVLVKEADVPRAVEALNRLDAHPRP